MWEVGLWGQQNVGSGTIKMLCHPPIKGNDIVSVILSV